MKLSTRTRYGMRAMYEIALAYPDKAIPVKEIASRQGLSPKYLEQIIAPLKASGLVKLVRGMHGGYTLASAPESVRLSEIFEALEGAISPVDCVDSPEECDIRDTCPTRDLWVEMKEAMSGVLERKTLQDLVDKGRSKDSRSSYMYGI